MLDFYDKFTYIPVLCYELNWVIMGRHKIIIKEDKAAKLKNPYIYIHNKITYEGIRKLKRRIIMPTPEPKPEEKPTEITLEKVQTFLTENDGAVKWLNSTKDAAVTKGVATFKTNFMEKEFPGLLDTEVEKRLPAPETDEAKRLKELEIKFTQSELDKDKANLQTELIKIANTEEIPDFFVEYSLSDTLENSTERLKTLGKKYIDTVNAAVELRLKGKGRPAPGSGKEDTDNITLNTLKDIRSMGDIDKNKAAIEALLKEAQAAG